MKMKKILCVLLTFVMTASMLIGCGAQNADTEQSGQAAQEEQVKEEQGNKDGQGKEKVTVALWGTQLLENYTQYLCDTFPEVEFEFTLATNSTDFYRYRNDHDDLPDILTVRGSL